MATTGSQRALAREQAAAKAQATLYQHTPNHPDSRQVRRAVDRHLAKERARADAIAARRERKRARSKGAA